MVWSLDNGNIGTGDWGLRTETMDMETTELRELFQPRLTIQPLNSESKWCRAKQN